MKKNLISKAGKRALLWTIAAITIPFIIILAILAFIISKMLYYKMIVRSTVSIISGLAIFAILAFLLKVSLVTSIFWGIAAIHLLLICSIEHLGTKNEIIGIATGAASLVSGVIGIIFFNYLFFFIGLIIYGVVLILLTLLKDFMNDDSGQPEDSYEYPYN